MLIFVVIKSAERFKTAASKPRVQRTRCCCLAFLLLRPLGVVFCARCVLRLPRRAIAGLFRLLPCFWKIVKSPEFFAVVFGGCRGNLTAGLDEASRAVK